MSQFNGINDDGISDLNPVPTSGTDLANAYLDPMLAAILSGHLGTTRPPIAERGLIWAKQINSTEDEIRYFDGTTDVLIGTINITTGVFALSIQGKLTIPVFSGNNNYAADQNNYAVHVGNGEIVGVNAIFFNDTSTSPQEGILFPRASGSGLAGYSSIWGDGNGSLRYAPVANGSSFVVLHAGNVTTPSYEKLAGNAAPFLVNADTVTQPGDYSVDATTVGTPDLGGAYDAHLSHFSAIGQSHQSLVAGNEVSFWRVKDGSVWSSWQRVPLLTHLNAGLDWPYNGLGSLPSAAGTRVFVLSNVTTSQQSHVEAYFECTAANNGFVVGTRVQMDGGITNEFTLSTNPGQVIYTQTRRPYLRRASDAAHIQMSSSQWQIRVRARDYA